MVNPIGRRILVKPIENDSKLACGIVEPQADTQKPMKGTVLAYGNELKQYECFGDNAVVIYPRYTGAEVEETIDGKLTKLIILEYEDVLGFDKK